jgi:hypothetical protein
MGNDEPRNEMERLVEAKLPKDAPPLPTTQFRRQAWLEFQRAIDPLAPPKPLRIKRRLH